MISRYFNINKNGNKQQKSYFFVNFSHKKVKKLVFWPKIDDKKSSNPEKISFLQKYNFDKFRQNDQTGRGQTDRSNCYSIFDISQKSSKNLPFYANIR